LLVSTCTPSLSRVHPAFVMCGDTLVHSSCLVVHHDGRVIRVEVASVIVLGPHQNSAVASWSCLCMAVTVVVSLVEHWRVACLGLIVGEGDG